MPESAYGRAALDGELAVLSSTPQGTRNAALNTTSFKLAGLVAGGELEAGSTRAALLNAAVGIGLSPEEAGATIDSGFQAGAAAPRAGNRPERPQNTVNKAFPKGKTTYITPDEKRATDAHARLLNDPGALSYLTEKRGLSLETVKQFKLGLETDGTGAKWLTIPHYNDGRLVNIKSRSLPPAEKSFKRVKGCRSVLYNADAISQNHDEIFLCEGEFDTLTLIDRGILNAVGTTAGAGAFLPEWRVQFEAVKKIYLCYDADAAGRAGARKVANALGRDRCCNVTLPEGEDLNSFLLKPGSLDKFVDIVNTAKPFGPEPDTDKTTTGIESAILNLDSFLSIAVPPRACYLSPWLREQSIFLITGWRGIGKTFFALGLLDSITKGESFGPWQCEQSAPCLYMDAEMPVQDIQERAKLLDMTGPRKNSLLIYSDAHANQLGLPRADLTNPEWRAAIKKILIDHAVKVWIIDNLTSCTAGLDENSRESWSPINSWLLELRFSGISTGMLHHTGKGGEQRGTSAREDNLDSSVMLSAPNGYRTEDGARFVCTFQKSRVGHSGLGAIVPTEFWLQADETGGCSWTYGSVTAGQRAQVLQLFDDGLSQKAVAEALGLSAGYVSKIRAKAIKDGYLSEKNKLTQPGFLVVAQGNF